MKPEKIFWAFAILLVAGLMLFLAFGGKPSATGSQAQVAYNNPNTYAAQPAAPTQQNPSQASAQEITLTVQGGSYMPNPIRVKKGIPVRITVDLNSVRGCATSIVMPDFGVSKTVRQGDNVIEFTPDKSGTFDFGCSMWMYRGKIVVEDSDGAVANYQGTGAATGASASGCKMGGGCGCGGAV